MRHPHPKQKGRAVTAPGFTLLELMLTVALIAILALFSLPVLQSFQLRNDLDLALPTVTQLIHRAQTLARANDGDQPWGIKIQPGGITLFQGASYATRQTAFDEVTELSPLIDASGVNELVFAKLTGDTTVSTTISLIATSTNEGRTFTINTKGMIDY
ncbi:MAG: type II secretion system protein [Patescibacteria group bacterium]